MLRHFVHVAVLALALSGAAANAALHIRTTGNITAGAAAFGTAQRLLDWTGGFSPGSIWTLGSYGGPIANTGSFTDAVTGATATGNLSVTNWIDGPGFDTGALAAPDLAINGAENVLLSFSAPVQRIGFAVASGRGLLPGEVASTGTSFTLLTSTGESAMLTVIDPGTGVALWVDVQSATPFTSLRLTETIGDVTDQYFGNFVTGSAVPEPANWALLLSGFAFTGAAMRRRAPVRQVTA